MRYILTRKQGKEREKLSKKCKLYVIVSLLINLICKINLLYYLTIHTNK